GKRLNDRGWTHAGAGGFHHVGTISAGERFRHLAAAGVADAYEQHALPEALEGLLRTLDRWTNRSEIGAAGTSHARAASSVARLFFGSHDSFSAGPSRRRSPALVLRRLDIATR